MAKKGRLFVISAPSGAGKTTLIKKLLKKFAGVSYSVSHTTRPPRPEETHGKDYFFINASEFEDMIDADLWLEWARVHGHYYGTSRTFVAEQLKKGRTLLLDIDVQGAAQIMASGLDPVSVFIMPPSLEELGRRLKNRGTDDPRAIARRLENAKEEIRQKHMFQYVLVNDDLETASAQLCHIFEKEMETS
ncbi:MAG TPA: guanylate kinase [Desulfotignum sp.]|nr:guanylate kinase [Desulfotignum sp.]